MSAGSITSLSVAGLTPTSAGAQPPKPTQSKDIRVGILTAPLRNLPFEEVLNLARRCNIGTLEVVTEPGNPHIDPLRLDQAQLEAIQQKVGERHLEISALSNFMNITAPGKAGEVQQAMIKTIDAAAVLGVPAVCMNLGTPAQGMSRIETIKKVIPGLSSASNAQRAVQALLAKDIIDRDNGSFLITDWFFRLWIQAAQSV